MRAAGVLCAVVLLVVCSAGTAGAEAWDGTVNGTWYQDETAAGHDGTSGNPFLIYNEKSLAALANETNTNESQSGFHDRYIRLMSNLDLNGTSHVWTPIGNTTEYQHTKFMGKGVFQGTFNGDNHIITGMNVTNLSALGYIYGGLFGLVNQSAITSVNLTNVVVNVQTNTYAYSGGLVGYTYGGETTITNCCVNGTVMAKGGSPTYSGGLVGYTSGSITNCYATGAVTASSSRTYSGGLVGSASSGSSITNCYATATVTASGSDTTYSGGLVGSALGSIMNCYATGAVTASGSGTPYSGGLVGYTSGSITNSSALNDWVNASSTGTINIGRFVGGIQSGPTITSPYAWRHMGLNISGEIIQPVAEDRDKNATNASTVMIWGNEMFYTNLGWTFGAGRNWTMSTDPDYRLPVLAWQNAAPAVDASYLNLTYAVTALKIGNGTIASVGTPLYQDGATVTFTLTPDLKHRLLNLTDNGENVTSRISSNTYTLSDLNRTHTLAARFTSYIITATSGTGGSINPPGDVSVDAGEDQIFTFTPASGYQIDSVTMDSASVGSPSSYTFSNVQNDHTIFVTFRLIPPVPPVPPVPSGSSDGNMDGAYRVLFDTTGGSTISPATGLSSGDRLAKPADPVRDGFTFGGWYTDEDGTGAWDFTGGIPGDMTLYAAWITDERAIPVTSAATRETAPHTTAPQQTDAAPVITTAEFTVSPALTEAPAPLAGLLAGLLAAGILLRRRE